MSGIPVKELIINDDKDIINILKDDSKILTILNYYYNYWKNDYIHSQIIKTQEIIYEYVIEAIKSEQITIEEHLMVQNYIKNLITYLKQEPVNIYSNPIFKLNEIFLYSFIDKQDYFDILKMNEQNVITAKNIYIKFMKDEQSISKEEFDFLIKYCMDNIDFNYDELIKLLMNSDNSYNQKLTKIFILKYITYEKSKELGKEIKLYFCDDQFEDQPSSVVGLCSDDNIYIKNSYYKNCLINKIEKFENKQYKLQSKTQQTDEGSNSFYDLIVTLYHEIAHSKQYFDEIDNKINSSSISEIEYLLFIEKFGYEEYETNYKCYDNELNADIEAYENTILFFKKMENKYFEKIKSKSVEEKNNKINIKSYSYKKDKAGKLYLNEYYIVDNLNKIIKNNPEKIDEYKVLQEIYTQGGNLKSLQELLLNRIDYMGKGLDYDIFDKFIIYQLSNSELSKLRISNMSFEQKYSILLSLSSVLNKLVIDVRNIKNNYNNDKTLQKHIISVLNRKKNLILEIAIFIKRNKGEFKSFSKSVDEEISSLEKIVTNFSNDENLNKKVTEILVNETKRNIK